MIAPGATFRPAVAASLEKACAEAAARPEYRSHRRRGSTSRRAICRAPAFRSLFDADSLDERRRGQADRPGRQISVRRRCRQAKAQDDKLA